MCLFAINVQLLASRSLYLSLVSWLTKKKDESIFASYA